MLYEFNENDNNLPYISTEASGDGYVNVRNMGGFSSMFSLKYIYDGKEYNLNTGVITLFFSSMLAIPAAATDIFVVVYISNALGEWVPIYNNTFEQSGVISLELHGTIWAPEYKVIQDTQPTTESVTVYNKAAYNSRLTVEYYVNDKLYKLSSGTFSVGMSRKISIPDIAMDQYVLIEMDATGLGNWTPIYNENFKGPTDLGITLSGTTMAPKVDINKISPITTPDITPVTPPQLVGGVGGTTNTIPHNSAHDIINKYMEFMQQTHHKFMDILNRTYK